MKSYGLNGITDSLFLWKTWKGKIFLSKIKILCSLLWDSWLGIHITEAFELPSNRLPKMAMFTVGSLLVFHILSHIRWKSFCFYFVRIWPPLFGLVKYYIRITTLPNGQWESYKYHKSHRSCAMAVLYFCQLPLPPSCDSDFFAQGAVLSHRGNFFICFKSVGVVWLWTLYGHIQRLDKLLVVWLEPTLSH